MSARSLFEHTPAGAQQTLEGLVKSIVFRAEEFAVIKLEVPGYTEVVTSIGALGHVREGETLHVSGVFETHRTYGKRLRVMQALPKRPQTLLGMERYLATLKGLGPETARKLVAVLGLNALDIIESEPWRAAQIKGIGKARIQKAKEDASLRSAEHEVMIFLQSYGISAAYAARILNVYKESTLTKVRENPYRLAQEIPGVGFILADKIAQAMGFEMLSPLRLESALLHVLKGAADDGHCYMPHDELIRGAHTLLGEIEGTETAVLIEELEAALLRLVSQRVLIREDERLFLPYLHRAELEIAKRALEQGEPLHISIPSTFDFPLSDAQRLALAQVCQSPLSIITGGPGTGKTTLIKAIVQAFKRSNKTVMLMAPTGRAAKRLSEATGHAASTIHRALEWNPKRRLEAKKLDADLIVCDEASMLDVVLAAALLQSWPKRAHCVFVGDVDQLPSVGPGRVLQDLIESQCVPVIRLSEIFRQAEGSGIVQNARRILLGEMPNTEEATGDFYFIEAEDPLKAQDIIVRLCQQRIPQKFHLNATRDIQVLTPMHKGEMGTVNLNACLQQALNAKAKPTGENVPGAFFVGDKVMQMSNDYDRDVWNGDSGIVEQVTDDEIVVHFDDRVVRYRNKERDQLELAYAVSIHKSQGSEYPAVVVPLFLQHYVMLQRNLLYTAVTRGKKIVVLVGSKKALQRAVQERREQLRYSFLKHRLNDGRVVG